MPPCILLMIGLKCILGVCPGYRPIRQAHHGVQNGHQAALELALRRGQGHRGAIWRHRCYERKTNKRGVRLCRLFERHTVVVCVFITVVCVFITAYMLSPLQYEPGSADGCKTASSKKSENTQQSWFGCRPGTWSAPWGTAATSTRPRSPAQLTSFCPALSKHLVKPANGSPGRELQLSTSCNPRILQIPGMFDGKAFL